LLLFIKQTENDVKGKEISDITTIQAELFKASASLKHVFLEILGEHW
jgi:hypothetical protein